MTKTKNIFAFTDPTVTLPDYVSINEDVESGAITLTARGEGITVSLAVPRIALRQMALSCATVSL